MFLEIWVQTSQKTLLKVAANLLLSLQFFGGLSLDDIQIPAAANQSPTILL